MTTVGYSTLDVIPSVKNLRSQLEAQTSRDFDAAGRKGGERFGDAAGKSAAGKFKARFGDIGREVFAPIAGFAAGAVVVDLFKDAIEGASDLAESGNKINVIFGDAAGRVEKFADKGAKALGQTKLQVLDAAGSFGTFGKAAGLSGNELADFSTKLAGLSTDMASFFNTSPEQAIEAIGAALRGEAEPIRAYGVLLDDATLRQEAMRQGLIETTKQALTPQQKVLAAYQVILKQTRDAQGDFSRTSGGLANQQRILSAQWSEMKTDLGAKLLPAVNATVHAFNDGVIPAIEGAGGVVADAAQTFDDLPAPVKAATAALVAFKVAQAVGVTSGLGSGVGTLASGMETLRLRTMLATDEYKNLRTATFETTAAAHVFSPEVGRMSAALGALKVGASGAGAGLKAGLSGALGLVGGPWGAAFIAGTAIVTHFWQEHQKAKQRVEEFTGTLDKETGAITENSREWAAKRLLDAGVLDNAQRLGISLSTVTDAALGQKGALTALNDSLTETIRLGTSRTFADKGAQVTFTDQARAAMHLRDTLNDTNGEVQKGIAQQHLLGAAVGRTDAATSTVTNATADYRTKLEGARQSVLDLLDAENKRRNKLLGRAQDELALADALRSARQEAKDGKRTLDEATEAGSANKHALLDLASAWNDAGGKIRNAKGAYAEMRQNFINVAEQMGATKTEAQKLADRLLSLPKNRAIEIDTPGMKGALRDVRELKRSLLGVGSIVITAQATKNRADRDSSFATGGLIGGRGSGTSDSNLIWASRGEFMQRKRAVDYYGVDFMRALNAMQVPRFAGGGLIGAPGPQVVTSTTPLGTEIRGMLSIDRDGRVFLSGVARAEVAADAEARLRSQRLAGIGGVPTR